MKLDTKLQTMKKYRVSGTFSYWQYGAEEESLKTVDVHVIAASKDDAAREPLKTTEYSVKEDEPAWLYGYPTVEFIEDVYDGASLRDYWTKAM